MHIDAILPRCSWAVQAGLMQDYHDSEWGIPCHDEARLFEMLILQGKQAGLSWSLILNRRERLRAAFDGFDPEKMAGYGPEKTAALLQCDGVIKNRLKVEAAIQNARAYLRLRETQGSLDAYIWRYVEGTPIIGRWPAWQQAPCFSPLSDQISKDLKKQGFTFVGATILYSYLQAIGVVNDHVASCFCCVH